MFTTYMQMILLRKMNMKQITAFGKFPKNAILKVITNFSAVSISLYHNVFHHM